MNEITQFKKDNERLKVLVLAFERRRIVRFLNRFRNIWNRLKF